MTFDDVNARIPELSRNVSPGDTGVKIHGVATNITDAGIVRLSAGSGRKDYRDAKQRGLVLRVSDKISASGGSARIYSWSWVARRPGIVAPVRLTFGRYPAIPTKTARDIVARLIANGGDLMAALGAVGIRTAAPTEPESEPAVGLTIRELYDAYMKEKVAKTNKPRTIEAKEYVLGRFLLPTWGKRPANTFKRNDAVTLLNAVNNFGPALATNFRAYVSNMYRWGMGQGSRFNITEHPIRFTDRNKSRVAIHIIPDADIKRLWRHWQSLTDANEADCLGEQFKLRLLLVQRGSEILHMRWSDLHLTDAAAKKFGPHWVLPYEFTKGQLMAPIQVEHWVPLAPLSVEIIDGLRVRAEAELERKNEAYKYEKRWGRHQGDGSRITELSDWVFNGRTRATYDMPIKNFFGKATREMKQATGVKFKLRDLRSTGNTLAVNAGCPDEWGDRLMTHVLPGVRRHYSGAKYYTEKRFFVFMIEQCVREIVGMKPIAKKDMAPEPTLQIGFKKVKK